MLLQNGASMMQTTPGLKDLVFDRPRAHTVQLPLQWHDGFGGWLVSAYELVDTVLREHRTYSADERRHGPPGPQRDNPVLRSMLALDPPEHHRLRRLVSRAFTPRAVDRAEERITSEVGRLLDALGPAPEVVAGFASPLTTTMIAELLGLPGDRRHDFVRWTHVIAGFAGPTTADPGVRAEFDGVVSEVEAFVRDSVVRGGFAEDTVLAALCAAAGAAADEEALSERELLDFLILLVVAGHETTTRLIYNAVLCLERYPDQLAALRAGEVGIDAVVEEVARHLPPTGGVERYVTAPAVLGGRELATGTRVVAMISAANRDPAVFVNPHRFDARRQPNPHLAFGRGAHACLGAHLARREARVALTGLLARVPGRWAVPDEELAATTSPVGIDVHRLVLCPA